MTFLAIGDQKAAPPEAIGAELAAAQAFLDVLCATMRANDAGNPDNPVDFAVNTFGTSVDRLTAVQLERIPKDANPVNYTAFMAHMLATTAGRLVGGIVDPDSRLKAVRFVVEGLNHGLIQAEDAEDQEHGSVH